MDPQNANLDAQLAQIRAWCEQRKGFAHIRTKIFLSVAQRAKALMERCLNGDTRIVYVVLNSFEKTLVLGEVTGLPIVDHWMPGLPGTCTILTHDELYKLAQTPECGGLATGNVILFVEVDVHYSLEFALSMVCLVQGAAETKAARVLTVSYHVREDSIIDALRLLAPGIGDFRRFALTHRPGGQQIPQVSRQRFGRGMTREIVNTLSRGQNVVMFCQESDIEPHALALKDFEVAHKCLILDKDPIREIEALISGPDNPDEDAEFLDDDELPTILFVPRLGRLPVWLGNLGLLVFGAERSAHLFDNYAGYTVDTTTQRTCQEVLEIMAHACSPERPFNFRAITNIARADRECPPRRIENDQMTAFLFEAIRHAHSVNYNALVECFFRDRLDIVPEILRRLQVGGWIELSQGRPSPVLPRASRLYSILPDIQFDFEPAAFLAGFQASDSDDVRRAAVRMAVLLHHRIHHTDFFKTLLQSSDRDENERLMRPAYRELTHKIFQCCSFPTEYTRYCTIWLMFGMWHLCARLTRNYREWNIANRRRPPYLDVLDGGDEEGEHEGKIFVDANLFKGMVPMVERLEQKLRIREPLSLSTVRLNPEDCVRIFEELLNGWLFRNIRLQTTAPIGQRERETFVWDVVGSRVDDLELEDANFADWFGAPVEEIVAVAMQVKAIEDPANPLGRITQFGRICVIPLSVAQSWRSPTGMALADAARSQHWV